MTICIIAICENSRVILVSDRMLTISDISIEFEHPSSKIEILSNNCCAVTAGDALPCVDIFSNAKSIIKQHSSLSIKEIAEETKKSYIEQRAKTIEELLILPRQLKNIETFYENIQSLPSEIGLHIDNKIQNFDFEIDIMIGGVDEQGPHIYFVENPGTIACYDSIGYCAIGSGNLHAELTFISYNYNTLMGINEALYVIYEAKKISERAPGVGKETDIFLIDKNGYRQISQPTIEILDEIYNTKKELYLKQYQQIKEKIDQISLNYE